MSAKCQKRTLVARGRTDIDHESAPALQQSAPAFVDWILPTGSRDSFRKPLPGLPDTPARSDSGKRARNSNFEAGAAH